MEAAVGHVADSESKSVLTDDSSQAHPASTRHPDLPASTALRVALAWALSNGEPSQAVLKSAVGVAQDLPDALHRLAKALETGSDRFPQVASFLAKSDPESPLLPKHLGLDAPRQNLVPDAAVGRNLSSAIVEDLGQALKQGRSEDAQVLREALNSLVSEGFDGARDPANPMASAPWTMPPRQDRPDSGRVVVHDRRRKGEDASNRTVVDVSMTPTGLGAVDARLELKGQDLNVEFRAREADTVAKLRGGLPELRQILTQLGFDTKDLDVKLGRKSPAKPAGTARSGGSGLDIRA